ncbi:homeobox and leucine zipper encoding a [Brachionichthys hirsutus]|uniref:homeobox and leucine zipper encoding a n=1 Tax=Brachionichthys hirsutus TaxID=412623 RepID=UPI003604E8C7
MDAYGEHNGRNGLHRATEESLEPKATEVESGGRLQAKGAAGSSESNAGGVASFTTNHNSVVCLPLVSEGLKLVWTQADQTRELDAIPELVQAFNVFPYPSSREVGALARLCALPLDKVKVWFMVQRIKYGISWSSEEIEETQRKLAAPELCADSPETSKEADVASKDGGGEELVVVDQDADEAEGAISTFTPQKKPMCESPDSYRPSKAAAPCFSSCLPPPQDSYFYRSPASAPAHVSHELAEPSTQRHRHSRYKKSKVQLAALRKSFLRENWPAEAELRRLQDETGLTRNDIRKWFSDSRYQLRVGRGSLAAAHGYSQHAAGGAKADLQSQPLPLTVQKNVHVNGVRGPDAARDAGRGNGMRNAHFFQTFLTSSLEAFGGRVLDGDGYDALEELSGDGDSLKDEEQRDDQPLQLTKTCKVELDAPQETSSPSSSHLNSSPSGSPPPAILSSKLLSKSIGAAKKSAYSARATPSHAGASSSSSSASPSLTPAGRPRKTKEQLDVLKQHFLRCQWPKSEDYTRLVALTGLPRADVIQWFGDTRYAVKNGQLRWVKGVRDQFLALAAEHGGGGGLTNGAAPRAGSRKRKAQAGAASSDPPDVQPLIAYYLSTGSLQEKDLDSLCKKSRMSYQQVRAWFAAQDAGGAEQEPVAAE